MQKPYSYLEHGSKNMFLSHYFTLEIIIIIININLGCVLVFFFT